MTALKKNFTVKREDKSSYISLNVLLKRSPLLSLMIVPAHEVSVVAALEANMDLIGNDKQVNLFDTMTIMDKLDTAWLYAKDSIGYLDKMESLSGDEITEIYINYIKNGVSPEWLIADQEFSKLINIGECGEDVLLSKISKCGFMSNDTNASRMTLQKFDSAFLANKTVCLYDRGIDYQSILDVTRVKYGVALTESVELDDAVFEGCRKFMRGMFADTKTIKELCEIAYESKNSLEFKKSITDLAKEYSIDVNPEGGFTDVPVGGYTLRGTHGIKKGEFTVSASGIYMAYLGYGDKLGDSDARDLEVFKGKYLWETMWHEFAAKHEESLVSEELSTKDVEVETEANDEDEPKTERNVSFHMTIAQVQKRLFEEYGVEYTEGYVGKIIKDTLNKLKDKLEERGVAYEDALELVD